MLRNGELPHRFVGGQAALAEAVDGARETDTRVLVGTEAGVEVAVVAHANAKITKTGRRTTK